MTTCARCGREIRREDEGFCRFCGGKPSQDEKPRPPDRPVSPHTDWGDADE